MSETKLLPCPFCGGVAAWGDGEQKHKFRNEQVYCTVCMATTFPDSTKAEAAAWWNARASQWIPVEERLPAESEHYLVFNRVNNPNHAVHIAYWSVERQRWMGCTNNSTDDAANQNIAAWMPLPAPYQPSHSDKVATTFQKVMKAADLSDCVEVKHDEA